MLLGDWLDDTVLDGVWLDCAVVADDWSELRVHEEVGVLSVLEDVRLDAAVRLTSECPVEDVLVSNAAAAVWRSFKERN